MQNYVGQALQNLSGTVEGLGRQIGDNRLRTAELGLKRATQALQIPGMQLQSQQAQDKLDQLNQPFTVSSVVGNNNPDSAFHMLNNFGNPKDPSPAEKIGLVMGAEIDGNGNYVRDGKPVTNREANKYAAQIQRVIGMESDPKKALISRRNMAERYLIEGVDRTGAPLDEKMKANLIGNIKKVDNMNSADWLRGYEQKLADLEATRAPFIDSGGNTEWIDRAIKQTQKKIDSYKATAIKAEDREYEKKVAEQAQKDKIAIEKIKLDGKDKKDTRSTLQKNAEFLAHVRGIPVKDALDIIRADKSMAERLRAYAQDLEPIITQLKVMDIEIDEYNKKRKQIAKRYGLDSPSTTGMPEKKDSDSWRNYQ